VWEIVDHAAMDAATRIRGKLMKILILIIWLIQPELSPSTSGPSARVFENIEAAAIEAHQATRSPPFNAYYRTELWEVDLNDRSVRQVDIPALKFVKVSK
jgi:hypothetical protein